LGSNEMVAIAAIVLAGIVALVRISSRAKSCLRWSGDRYQGSRREIWLVSFMHNDLGSFDHVQSADFHSAKWCMTPNIPPVPQAFVLCCVIPPVHWCVGPEANAEISYWS
jgi:hypothetical protein